MFKPGTSTVAIIVFSVILVVMFRHAREEAQHPHRDPEVLMNRYYLLRGSEPEAARKALSLILRQEQYIPALQEQSQIYINEKKIAEALPLMEQLHQLAPYNQKYSFQLATLYYEHGDWDKAQQLLTMLKKGDSWDFKIKAQNTLNQMDSFLPHYQSHADIVQIEQQTQAPGNSSSVVNILLNHFYKQKNKESKQAQQLLSTLNLIAANNANIQLEMGYWSLEKKEQKQAIAHFLLAYDINPSPEIALQLAYLYAGEKQNEEAAHFFLIAGNSTNPELKASAAKGYAVVTQGSQATVLAKAASQEILFMDQYYALKKQNKKAAWQLIQRIISLYPNNLVALKEGGFLAIDLKHRNQAITYFSQAYELNYEPDLAMQLGYLYGQPDGLKMISRDNVIAYQYFHLATRSSDKSLELRAQNAMTNLSGLQTKALPDPFFSEVFFDPFTQNRFGLTVRPFIGRLGIEHDNRWQSKSYMVLRRTQDNKSVNAGQVPQIYEDNVQILGVGEQITPIAAIPLVGFIEAGRAYDLIYRNRDRWRNDVRAGFMYYNEFGARPAYFDHPAANANYYSTVYGDVTYFSRYNNNIIGTIKTHQGLRLLQYRSSMLNVYVTGRVIEDTRREFFNNIGEVGPGISFIPSNRYKVELRFEHVNGVYLPAGRIFNPYGSYYTNNTVQLFFYTKL